MFNDKLQPIYDGKVLVNQTAMDNPVVKAALAEMSQRNFEPQRMYGDLMRKAKRFEVVEDDDYKVTIDYENLTTTFELK